jgi:hypothetical protein
MRRLLPIVGLAVLLTAGCTPKDGTTGSGPGGNPTTTTAAGNGSGGTAGAPKTTAAQPPEDSGTWKVRYDFGVPAARITITNRSLIPLPSLAEIHTGDHSNENPGYDRISFYFRGGMPSYNFNYAAEVLTEGRGDRVPLEGNAFLRVQFSNARQHDDAGADTLKTKPNTHIGYHNLVSYGFGGDFEGYVTYGLGIHVAPNSDQVLQIRVGELTKKPDGKGGFFYVVAFDVKNG